MKQRGLLSGSRITSGVGLFACLSLLTLAGCGSGSTTANTTTTVGSAETVEAVEETVDIQSQPSQDEYGQSEEGSEPATTPVSYQATTAIAPTLNLESGLTYPEARARLIQQGWTPDPQPAPGPYGVEREMYDNGFAEVSGCAGTGLGQCRFEFYHPSRMASGKDNLLSVTTYGGSDAEVADWSVYSESSTSEETENAITQQSTVPPQFQGLWNHDSAECSVPYSTGQLVIEADRLQFYESSGPVTEVLVKSELEAIIYAEQSSEGTSYITTRTFELSSDRNTLTDTTTGGVRYRCTN